MLAVDHENEAGELSVQVVLVLVRADHSLNEVKLSKIDGLNSTRMATEAEIAMAFNTTPGYIGPVATAQKVRVVADKTVANMSDFVCGANDVDFHYVGVNWGA